jgi:predicted HAD superfamily hydrolase
MNTGMDLNNIFQKINKVEVVSFDIFDTLIHRRVFQPTDVFEMVKLYIISNKKELYLENKMVVNDFRNIRATSETKARENAFKRFGNHEILLDAIYETIFELYPISIEHLNIIKEIEIECDLFCFYPNPEIKKVFNHALTNNKKIVLSTDMYLPTVVLKKILSNCGYEKYQHLYCSGELKVSKSKGDMFSYISKALNVKPDKIFHIGDNHHSDYESPTKNGVQAMHLDLKSDMHALNVYKERSYHENMYFRNFTDSVIEATIIKIRLENPDKSKLFNIGYSVFGPIFAGFFIWILNNLKQNKVDKVLFFARDAYVIRQLYLKYAEKFGVTTPEEYVYISRASSLIASFTDYNVDRLKNLFSGRIPRSVIDKLKSIGIDANEVREEVNRIGFYDMETKVDYSSEKLHSLLIRLPGHIQNEAKDKRKAILPYIEKVIGNNNKVAIVDIGWSGNMQGGFSRIAKLLKPGIAIDGYYLGTSDSLKKNNLLPDNNFSGFLTHNGEPEHIYKNILSPGGIELIEFAFVAPHGTTLGYKGEGKDVEPILEKSTIDEDYYNKASELQSGVFKFVEEIMPIISKIGMEHFIKVNNWAQPFYNFSTAPKEEDVSVFGELTHSDGVTDTKTRLHLAKKLPMRVDENSTEYVRGYAGAIWKKGFETINKKK